MKKFSIICGLALALLTVGCVNETTEDINPSLKTSISVSLDQTRTYLGEVEDGVYPILWSAGDEVAINGVTTAVADSYVGKNVASFESVAVAEEYSVFYPASLLNEDSVYKNAYTISDVQEFVEGSFAENTSILVGHAEHATEGNTKVSLLNVYGYLKINITSASEVKSVYVSATADEAISGTFAVDYEEATVTPLAGSSIIRVMGVEATEGVANVVVAVPAGVYAKGFTVKIIDNNNYSMTKTIGATDGVTIERAQLYILPSLDYTASTAEEVEINNATELQAFLTAVDAGDYSAFQNANGEVVLGNDIDLTGVTLTGSTVTGADAAFKGVFNGQGYALKNWTTSSALFAENRGTIKNIVFDSSCKWTPAATGDQALLVVKNYGTVSGVTANVSASLDVVTINATLTIGAIVSKSYATIENCVNNGNITITNINWTSNNIYAGGIVGYINKNGDNKFYIGNCINNGSLSFSTATDIPGKNYYVGGVFGCSSSTAWGSLAATSDLGTAENCLNTGNITCERKGILNGTYANIGGVTGYIDGDLVNCVNSGDVAYNCPTDTNANPCTRASVGGVAGVCTFSVTDCYNHGKVTLTGTHAAGGNDTTTYVGAVTNPCVGGVVGQVGNILGLSDKISGCYNFGEIVLDCTMKSGGGTLGHFGGVMGATNYNVENCHNHGVLTINNASMKQDFIGGVIGRVYQGNITVSDCTNNADITFKNGTSQCYIGGVVGIFNLEGCTITECDNYNTITITQHSATSNSYVGGIIGSTNEKKSTVQDVENSGHIVITPAAKWRVGGIAGSVTGTMLRSKNTGNLTASQNNAGAMGSIAGFSQANITNCSSDCTITSSASTPCGGLVGTHGNTTQSWNGNTLKFTIIAQDAVCGIICGSNTAASDGKISTIGDALANKVKAGSTINGVAVTAEDCTDLSKLYGSISTEGHGVLGSEGVTFVQ